MKIMVSACLLGHNCKYNGGNNYSGKLKGLLDGHTVIPVCPECSGGLPVPRTPCEIRNGTVIDKDGISHDAEFRLGAEKCLSAATAEQIDMAILQSRSPSCGVGKIYDGSFTGNLTEGNGIFAQMLIKAGIKVIDIGDI